MTTRLLPAFIGAIAFGGPVAAVQAAAPLQVRTLHASVLRVGSLQGRPLYGVHVQALVCARSAAEANRILPTSFRIAHHVTPGKGAARWGAPFRVVQNELHWLVSLGESTRRCRTIGFEDLLPQESYGGVESPLGALGYSRTHHCYGVRLTLQAALENAAHTASRRVSATGRAIVLCGRFRPR